MKKLLYLLLAQVFLFCQANAQVKLYGLASKGGSDNLGTIFHCTSAANSFTLDHSFLTKDGVIGGHPSGGLMDGGNGKYYGVTSDGGLYDGGVLFEWDPATNVYIKKYDFGQGTNGRLPIGPLTLLNGKLYGVCNRGGVNNFGGVIFEWDLDINNATPYRELVNFDYATGNHPTGTLAAIDTKLYGMTADDGGGSNTGTIFEMDTDPNNPNPFRVIISLDYATQGRAQDGCALTAWNGLLYGMGATGGGNGNGTLFKCDPDPNNVTPFTKLYDFDGTNGGLPYGSVTQYNGKLYGMTSNGGASNTGVLFSFDLDNNNATPFTKLVDFDVSNGQYDATGKLYESRGILFGTTSSGGANYGGTIFEYDTDPANPAPFLVKVNLNNNAGSSPLSTLVLNNNKFYGITYRGGSGSTGVIFEWDTASANYTKKIDFNFGENGATPEGSLVQVGGKLYGVTKTGGQSPLGGYGTIFEIDTLTGVFTKKQDFGNFFNGVFLTEPVGALSLYNNKLYGTTRYNIFEWDPSSNIITAKADLNTIGAGGSNGALTLFNGKFYGMTPGGGANTQGVLFEWDPSTNALTKKIDFGDGTNGSLPQGGLTLYNGKFYGVTLYGGSSNWGILFEWDPITNAFISKQDFDGVTTGAFPGGTLAIMGNKLYGMTQGYGQGGTVYEWDPSANTIIPKVDFSGVNGAGPLNSLTVSEGKLYGMTGGGGALNSGVIFEYDPLTDVYNILKDLGGTNGSLPKGNLLALSNETPACTPTSSSTSVRACSPYNWNGTSYTSSGTYTYLTTNARGCDSTATLNLTIVTSSKPARPAAINGPTYVCPYIGTGTATYSVTPVPANVLKYSWTLPPNVTIVSGTVESPSITVSFASGFVSNTNKTIKVKAIGCSGNSLDKSLKLSVIIKPVISGNAMPCPSTTEVYTGTAPAGSTYTYMWTVPRKATIIGSSTGSSITVSFSSTFSSGRITAKAVSECGTNSTKSLSVEKCTPLARPSSIATTVSAAAKLNVSIYPNPSNGDFNISVDGAVNKVNTDAIVEIVNEYGQVVYHKTVKSNSIIPVKIKSFVANGIYMVRFIVNGEIITKKIIINR